MEELTKNQPRYSDYLVAYIDILGFGEIVRTKSFDRVNEVHNIFWEAFEYRKDKSYHHSLNLLKPNEEKDIKLDQALVKIVSFSDCVVWTYPLKDVNERSYFIFLFALSSYFNMLQNRMFYKGVAIRGGISAGDLYFEGNKIFGPALVKAYELEKKANFPRILIDKEILDVRIHPNYKKYFSHLHFIPEGDYYYLNYFSQIEIGNKLDEIEPGKKLETQIDKKAKQIVLDTFIRPVVIVVNAGIHHTDKRIRSKYEWLKARLLAIDNLDFDWKDLKFLPNLPDYIGINSLNKMEPWEALRDEKNHMEGLLNQRFNYFLIVVGLVVATIPQVETPGQFYLVIFTGFVIITLLIPLIGRAERRLEISIKELAKIPDDPTDKIKNLASKTSWPFNTGFVWLMPWIPILTWFGMLLILWLAPNIYNTYIAIDPKPTEIVQSSFVTWLISIKGGLQLAVLISGLAGIGLALYGGIKLFTRISLLNEIQAIDIDARFVELPDNPSITNLANAIKNNAAVTGQAYNDLLKKFSDEVKRASKVNDDEYKDAKARYMPFIILGSILSLASLILSFVSSIE